MLLGLNGFLSGLKMGLMGFIWIKEGVFFFKEHILMCLKNMEYIRNTFLASYAIMY